MGRRGGVKAWLQVNIPALYVRYTTVMRYKAMAKRLRQVTGLADPVPAAAVLGPPAQGGTAADSVSFFCLVFLVGAVIKWYTPTRHVLQASECSGGC